MIKLTKTLEKQIINHAKQIKPQECCGLIVETDKGKLIYIPCTNVAPNPETHFQIADDDWIFADGKGTIQAVVHSHLNNLPYLSEHDRHTQLIIELDFILVVDDKILYFPFVPKLLGREFQYGKYDCGTIARDVYMLSGYLLANCVRQDMYGDAKDKKLINHALSLGFKRLLFENVDGVDLTGLQAGDLLMFTISQEACHVGVYLGNGQFIHHIDSRLSRREYLSDGWQTSLHSVWRLPDFKPEHLQGALNDMEL